MPVMFPPGRLRLATSPSATGSPPIVKTIGSVVVARLAARAVGSPPVEAITANLTLDQLSRQRRQSVPLTHCPAPFDRNISAFRIASFIETLPKRGNCVRQSVRRLGIEKPDHGHCRLLCARRERPCGRAADKRYELAALHSITSSARASSLSGTSRLSALAVLRLSTSSNLVDCTTGRSPGFSPLRMRPA